MTRKPKDEIDKVEKGRSRKGDPSTSKEAAELVPVSLLQNLFMMALKAHHPVPLTTTEIANYHDMDRDSFSPRPPRMKELGWIEECEKRPCENSAGKMRMMKTFRLTKLSQAIPKQAVA